MRTIPIDILIDDVNKIAKHPDPDSLRVGVMLDVVHVLRQIGVEYTCELVEDERITVKEGKFQIPEDVMLIEDFRHVGGDWSGLRMGSRQQTAIGSVAYRETPMEVLFPYFRSGDLIMKSYKLYRDEDGMPSIPSAAYEACSKYCRYRAVESRGDTQSIEWRERYVMEQQADRAIYYARAHFNTLTSASTRNTGQSFLRGKTYR